MAHIERVTHHGVAILPLPRLAVDVGQDGARELYDGDDQGAERDGAEVVAQRATHGGGDGEAPDVLAVGGGLGPCEVPVGDCARDGGGANALQEGVGPQQAEKVVREQALHQVLVLHFRGHRHIALPAADWGERGATGVSARWASHGARLGHAGPHR